jgi:hypothetical protein
MTDNPNTQAAQELSLEEDRRRVAFNYALHMGEAEDWADVIKNARRIERYLKEG